MWIFNLCKIFEYTHLKFTVQASKQASQHAYVQCSLTSVGFAQARTNYNTQTQHHEVGANLNKPHTSVTSLRTCVCMFACLDQPQILNECTKIDIVKHVKTSGGLTVRVQPEQRPEACVAT